MEKFIKGMDLSTMLELEELGAKYYDHGQEGDVLEILKKYGTNAVRLRLWVDPYDEKGNAYGAGTNDLERTLVMAKKVCDAKVDFLLNFHYSDFWTDPGKQLKPKSWEGLTVEELEKKMYDYTRETLEIFIKTGVKPTMIQIGNELSNGLLWPEGQVPHYEQIAKYVSAGIRAVRDVDAEIPIMIHLDNGGKNELYREWFDAYFANKGEDFEVIGLSYYPFWHGDLNSLKNNMNDIAVRYGKDLIVAEVSMGYTMEDYRSRESDQPETLIGMATRPEVAARVDYPMTIQGQMDFTRDFLEVLRQVPENRGCGFYWWEPAWIPTPGSGWATPSSLAYMKSPGPCGNEWANQALFDYDGNTLPTLELISAFEK